MERPFLESCDRVQYMVYSEEEEDMESSCIDQGHEEPFCVVRGIDFENYLEEFGGDVKWQSSLQIHDLQGASKLMSYRKLNAHHCLATRPHMSDIVSRETSNNSQSSRNITQFWLKTCKKDHRDCRALTISKIEPGRLLDLRERKSMNPRLCLTKSLPLDLTSATLSHKWGKTQLLRLTTASLEAMQNEIDVSLLSQTFRDVLKTTQHLEMRYLGSIVSAFSRTVQKTGKNSRIL